MSTAYAPGKSILFGEHAVVYGHPAIAAPVQQVRAEASVRAGEVGSGVFINAPDVNWDCGLASAPAAHPLRAIVMNTLSCLQIAPDPDIVVRIRSSIPMACGLGSGTAVSVAVVRALAGYFGVSLTDETVSQLTFEVEKIYHGTPSGIDNAVITYEKPVYFIKGKTLERLVVSKPFRIAIADTGVCSHTWVAVGDVRSQWELAPQRYDSLFDEIGNVSRLARRAIESGSPDELGPLMNENQRLLRAIDVSSPELETLIEAALRAGAMGAKLSGAGRGGNMIALVSDSGARQVEAALRAGGARNVIVTEIA
jgi:mevalonate kinase